MSDRLVYLAHGLLGSVMGCSLAFVVALGIGLPVRAVKTGSLTGFLLVNLGLLWWAYKPSAKAAQTGESR